jgi:TrmH family RNA methyltransferase
MITSAHNKKIQELRALQRSSRERRDAGVFIVEGVRLLEEALSAGWQAQAVFYTENLEPRGRRLLEGFAARGAALQPVLDSVLAAASDTETPQGVLAVLQMQTLPYPQKLNFVLIPDQVRDPGNLGTMLRTAAAAGVQAVFLPAGVVDPFSPKVLRAGMGAHFRLPLLLLAWNEIQAEVARRGLRLYLAETGSGVDYSLADFVSPLALIVGGEAEGAGVEAQALADQRVFIPMPGGSESLNAAVAAGVLLFEVVRQRGLGSAR